MKIVFRALRHVYACAGQLWTGKIFMLNAKHNNSPVRHEFFKPLFENLTDAKPSRKCSVLGDGLWLEAGVRRCLGLYQSGRDFLQHPADSHETGIRVSTWFESLKSSRRLRLLKEINQRVAGRMKGCMPDPFASHACLRDFDIYAGDGHFVAAATHDRTPVDPATAGSTGVRQAARKYATPHIYAIGLRSHAMSHPAVADLVSRKKKHGCARSSARMPEPCARARRKDARRYMYGAGLASTSGSGFVGKTKAPSISSAAKRIT